MCIQGGGNSKPRSQKIRRLQTSEGARFVCINALTEDSRNCYSMLPASRLEKKVTEMCEIWCYSSDIDIFSTYNAFALARVQDGGTNILEKARTDPL